MEEKRKQKRHQWHSGFYASIQIELQEDAEDLIFENEHQLSTKPLSMDVLVIKKLKEKVIKKKIGKIFRGHNIIEYKSPDDSLSVDDFYKVIAYVGLYKSDVECVDTIKADDITITYVSKSYPRKMIKHIRTVQKLEVVEYARGIYYIIGGMFVMQLLVTSRLPMEENFWLKNLTNDLKNKEDAELILKEYEKNKRSNLHKSVMDLIVRANEEKFEEARGYMCDALVELMQDVIDEKVEERVEEILNLRVEELAVAKAEELAVVKAEELAASKVKELIGKKLAKGKSVEQIADELEENIEYIKKMLEDMR